jgi:hypothetical protein
MATATLSRTHLAPTANAAQSDAYLRYPDDLPDSLTKVFAEIKAGIAETATSREWVEAVRTRIQTRFEYVLPGQEGAAQSLDEFLSGTSAGGHCEYFATALALMLRMEGLPCRVVTGYRSNEWDAERNALLFRARHAHAWVEVWDSAMGWRTVDATPPNSATIENASFFARVGRFIEDLWQAVTMFDEVAQQRTLARAKASWSSFCIWVQSGGWAIVLGLLAALAWRRRIVTRRRPQAIGNYMRALRRAGLRLERGETPRELLLRAETLGLAQSLLAVLSAATESHEQARYQKGCMSKLKPARTLSAGVARSARFRTNSVPSPQD